MNRFLKDFISENSLTQNLLLVLIFLFFLIVWIDLSSELAKEKDEIGTITAIFEDACKNSVVKSSSAELIKIPECGYVYADTFSIILNPHVSEIHNKAPPSVLL